MVTTKISAFGVTYGLGEAGYDIRIKQDITFLPHGSGGVVIDADRNVSRFSDNFVIASAIEEFDMPDDLVGIVHDKSSWARRGLSVFNTVIESGFKGGLTLELVYHGNEGLFIPAGSGIAQVIFHSIAEKASYSGKYQGQSTNPEPARES